MAPRNCFLAQTIRRGRKLQTLKTDSNKRDGLRRLQKLSAALRLISRLHLDLVSLLEEPDSCPWSQERQDLELLCQDSAQAMRRAVLSVQRLALDLELPAADLAMLPASRSDGLFRYGKELRASRRLKSRTHSSGQLTAYRTRADSQIAAELRKALRVVDAL